MQLEELKTRFTVGKMLNRISNTEIENTITAIDDLPNNFVGVFSSNKLANFID